MTDTVAVALITALPPTLVALITLYVALITKAKIIQTHDLTNSKMTELLEAEKGKAHAEGKEQERAEERDRQHTL